MDSHFSLLASAPLLEMLVALHFSSLAALAPRHAISLRSVLFWAPTAEAGSGLGEGGHAGRAEGSGAEPVGVPGKPDFIAGTCREGAGAGDGASVEGIVDFGWSFPLGS